MKLILGDDQAIFLDALSTVLTQRGYDVGAVARSPEEMIAHVHHQRPDACLLDCNLAIDDGIETVRKVIEACPTTIVVVLSADPDGDAADRAMDAGASGYLHQSRGVEVLVAALERILLNGERVVDVPGGTARKTRRASHADNLAATLTGRERECLSLLVAGMDTAAMVEQMGVSRTTVRTHLQAVLTKLCVHSRLEAASFAVRHRRAAFTLSEQSFGQRRGAAQRGLQPRDLRDVHANPHDHAAQPPTPAPPARQRSRPPAGPAASSGGIGMPGPGPGKGRPGPGA